ncbi:hypothetical protein H9P43_003169 [Blastocladiella emersonii ATCC 22665]|nr:hypothetical protein H9P43_003169 [Blastocladiella emersonii ATCC 22665]
MKITKSIILVAIATVLLAATESASALPLNRREATAVRASVDATGNMKTEVPPAAAVSEGAGAGTGAGERKESTEGGAVGERKESTEGARREGAAEQRNGGGGARGNARNEGGNNARNEGARNEGSNNNNNNNNDNRQQQLNRLGTDLRRNMDDMNRSLNEVDRVLRSGNVGASELDQVARDSRESLKFVQNVRNNLLDIDNATR